MISEFSKLQKLVLSLPFLGEVILLIYRLTLYKKIPVSSGDPYGLGDIIELFIGIPVFLLIAGIFFWGIIEIYRKRAWTQKATTILFLSIVQYVGFRWGYLFFAHLIRP